MRKQKSPTQTLLSAPPSLFFFFLNSHSVIEQNNKGGHTHTHKSAIVKVPTCAFSSSALLKPYPALSRIWFCLGGGRVGRGHCFTMKMNRHWETAATNKKFLLEWQYFFGCWFFLLSVIPVLFLYLLFFLRCLSLFGRCWNRYKELWQRAVTALTHACFPSYSLSIAESQTHAHVWKTRAHSTVALWITHTVRGLRVQQAKYFLFSIFFFNLPLLSFFFSPFFFLSV